MERRRYGNTGLSVGVLGYGGSELRGEGNVRGRPISPEDVSRLLNGALDAGINYVDTAPDYGEGEANIGRAIGHRRDDYVLAGKCGCPADDGPEVPRPLVHDYSRTNIVEVVERSLGRLRTDHLDVLQFHASPSRTVIEREDAIATLHSLRDQGKTRFIGCSSVHADLADHLAMNAFDAIQLPYSALKRENEELMSAAAAAGVAVVVRGSVAKKLPGGGDWPPPWDRWAAADLDELLDGRSRVEFLLRFTISHPAVSTTIVGSLNLDHVRANIDAVARGPLPEAVYDEARRRLTALDAPAAP